MEKLWTYIIIIAGIMVLFNLVGLNTTTGYVLGTLGFTSPESSTTFQDTGFWSKLIWGLGLLSGAVAIVIGIFGRDISTLPISSAIAVGFLAMFLGDLIGIINTASAESTWVSWLLYSLMVPLIIGFAFTLWDWVRGRD